MTIKDAVEKNLERNLLTIRDVPMLTTDEVEICLNSIIYTTNWSGGYGYSEKGKAEIEALRVISVDNTRRFFRARCSKGCESEFSYKDGCAKKQIFGKLESAVADMIEKINKDLEAVTSKQIKMHQTISHIKGQIAETKKIKPKEPKKVSV